MTRLLVAAVVALVFATPRDAGADILLTPFAGLTFGNKIGDASVECESEPCSLPKRAVYGGAIAVIGARGLGVEAEVGFVPNFFTPDGVDSDLLGANHVTTLMGNVMFVGSVGGVRPYVIGGGGMFRSRFGDFGEGFDSTDSTFGMNLGGGVFVGSGRLRLRGDIRYFRSLTESDEPVIGESMQDLRFWRATAGLSFGF